MRAFSLSVFALLFACSSPPTCADDEALCDAGASDAGMRDACTGAACECAAPSRVCGEVCAACPDPAHVVSFACDAGACVAAACEDGFAVCEAGCCELDVRDVTLATGARLPSIAIDSTGRAHVAFLVNHYDLTYARLDASGWGVEPIGVADENEYTAAIALDSNDRPAVAFQANYAIKLARFDGSAWENETIFASAQGYGPTVAQQGLVFDSSDTPHVAAGQEYYQSTTYGARVMHFRWDGAAWQRSDLVEYGDNRISQPSIAISDDDVLHVSWLSYYDDLLHHARNATGTWMTEQASASGNCCDSSFVALASDGTPRVAYEGAARALSVAENVSGTWSARPLTDDMGAMLGTVGSLAVDSTGALHWAYTNLAGQLVYVEAGVATIAAEMATEFMMVLDAEDRAHIVYTTGEGLYYVRY
jgi:hypothetical protein